MPCDMVRLCTVDFIKVDPKIFKRALKGLGWRIISENASGVTAYTPQGGRFTVDFKGGKAVVNQGDERIVDEAKRAYGFELAKTAAKRFNWNFKRTGQNSFVISRRY